jgi:uncharacterized protein Yka (UPF0111/DUF47 family)
MKFEQPPQEPIAPESQPEVTKAESPAYNLERFEGETDRKYRSRLLDMIEEIAERLPMPGERTEEDTELLRVNEELIARAKEVNEKILNERREKLAIEGKKQIPQDLYEGFIRMASAMGESAEKVEKLISEFYEPVPDQVEENRIGDEEVVA